MGMPLCDDPFPDDPIRPSRAATILGVRVRVVYRRIERGQLRAWRDEDSGQLRVSEAEVRAKWQRVERPGPLPRRLPRPVPSSVRERQIDEAMAEARRLLKMPPLETPSSLRERKETP
ncbi:MAG TPA: hypothetical protein VKA46_00285 [Gemmataceae bacterium]|nr:hypothetical protein [Gemmataceae bacterium]